MEFHNKNCSELQIFYLKCVFLLGSKSRKDEITPSDAPSYYEAAVIDEKWPLDEEQYIAGRNFPYVELWVDFNKLRSCIKEHKFKNIKVVVEQRIRTNKHII